MTLAGYGVIEFNPCLVDFYIGAGNSNPYLDKRIKSLDFLTGQERAGLVEFLESLSGRTSANRG